MKTNKDKINRGAILHAVAKRSTKTITQISTDAGYEKSSFYVHVKQDDLPLEILYKYGRAIPHNFGIEIPEMADYLERNGIKKAEDEKPTYEEIYKEKEYWKDKFYSLLEEHNNLLKGR